MIKLISIYRIREATQILYNLLAEREPHQAISHKGMPTMEEHIRFVQSRPYQCWYLIEVGETYVGAIYLSKQREIGISIFKAHRGRGFARAAVAEIMHKWPGRFLANINPSNQDSIRFFRQLGGKHIQVTYEL
jgi:RimJ/RimL family protein N-acetyltransferase